MFSKIKQITYIASLTTAIFSSQSYAQSDLYIQFHSGYTQGTYKSINQAYYDTTAKFGAGNTILSRGKVAVGAGFGYNFDNNLRFDLTFIKLPKEKVALTAVGQASSNFSAINNNVGSYSANLLMLNSYYDMKSSDQITPYLTGGLGLGMLSSVEMFYPNPAQGSTNFLFGKYVPSKNRLAFQLGFGFALKINEQFDLDFGYRFTQVRNATENGYGNFNNNAFLLALRIGL